MSNNITALREKSPEAVQKTLIKITEKHGHITPEFVLQEAKNPKSVLHNYFVWDDTKAANLFRQSQARFLIRNVKFEIIREKTETKEIVFETVRAFESPPSIRGTKSYLPLKTVMEDDELKAELLARAKIELNSIKARYKQLNELAVVWDAIEMI